MRLNLSRTLARSAANGPGERFVMWVQGCPLACPGCWNPDTWSFHRQSLRDTEDLVAEILTIQGIEGVTFTGGEPFMQARSLAEVGRAVRKAGLSVFIFTGYYLHELGSDAARELLAVTDVLVSGRYVESARQHGVSWRSSSNQAVHFLTDRYAHTDMERSSEAEIRINADGQVTLTGFPEEELLTVISTESS
ncbi:MAG: radical SAM protein [Myxococcales bacterium]|nr:radical SAM protein [Myxococcales bacterium]